VTEETLMVISVSAAACAVVRQKMLTRQLSARWKWSSGA
jgi:hypothetical protein